jgi:hypothetical protein
MFLNLVPLWMVLLKVMVIGLFNNALVALFGGVVEKM